MRVPQASAPPVAPALALLADRDRSTLQMYAEYLRHAAWEVDEAEDGREALAKAISRLPNVIVTETRLPGIDGYHLCELLRTDAATRAIPIIVVTADAYPAGISRAERSGADLVLTKPCLPDQLLEKMQQVLERSRQLRKHADAVLAASREQVARSTFESEKSRQAQGRVPLSRAFDRHNPILPLKPPPTLFCPMCDSPLTYERSHIGGVSESHKEQWDYYECPQKCGSFQYRQRTRKIRQLS